MAYRDEVLADSPRGYWRFGEASGTVANDETANNLDGSYVGSPTLGVTGAVVGDTAVTLSGSAQYVSIPDDNLLDPGDTLSVECWIKRASSDATLHFIVDKGDNGYLVYIDTDNKIKLGKKQVVGVIVSSTSTITDTNWHHIVVTKNGATSRVYIDGADVSSAGTNQTIAATALPLNWGRYSGTSSLGTDWAGSLDEAAIYGSALSLARVQVHYNASTISASELVGMAAI